MERPLRNKYGISLIEERVVMVREKSHIVISKQKTKKQRKLKFNTEFKIYRQIRERGDNQMFEKFPFLTENK